MINNIRTLRRVIATDAIGTGGLALLAVIVARPLADVSGIPVQWLVIAGLALLPFAAWVGWLARQENPSRKLVWLLIAANAMWIAHSLLLAFSGWLPLTAWGIELVVLQALLTCVIATLELVALRRASSFTHSHA